MYLFGLLNVYLNVCINFLITMSLKKKYNSKVKSRKVNLNFSVSSMTVLSLIGRRTPEHLGAGLLILKFFKASKINSLNTKLGDSRRLKSLYGIGGNAKLCNVYENRHNACLDL